MGLVPGFQLLLVGGRFFKIGDDGGLDFFVAKEFAEMPEHGLEVGLQFLGQLDLEKFEQTIRAGLFIEQALKLGNVTQRDIIPFEEILDDPGEQRALGLFHDLIGFEVGSEIVRRVQGSKVEIDVL